MKRKSAGLVMFRFKGSTLEILLGHMGGPYWAKKDAGAWSIPKGEYDDREDSLAAAKREFCEETGFEPGGEFITLGMVRQPSGKEITAWAFPGDCDPALLKSNTFELEWPPRSGTIRQFPEIDRAQWFPTRIAKQKILKGQIGFIEKLCSLLSYDPAHEKGESAGEM